VTNVEAEPNRSEKRVKELLVAQVSSPVRWEESMRKMIDEGVEQVLEIGPREGALRTDEADRLTGGDRKP